ncbi:hypothetical protein F6U93_07200 [Tamlana haliotis]|uniref:Preprotein translocase subunit SecB n=1 Tax=Pseudotamlana haliotis TaxID=2614804 RepID=A0A6N6MET6_9FLAO|nr:hypothetical protein [Tamlana haliotis]KAB1068270.1 hypothetical protein F6U93_07200 [Tamlana haliotis]
MNKEVKIEPEKIHLFHVNIVESAIKDVTQKEDNNFTINIAQTTMHNLKDERVKIGLFVDLIDDNVSSDAKAHFVFDFHFKIDELSSYYELKEDNSPIFAGTLIATLLGISFSTARGIIFERLSNTNMQGMILPVVSPQKMLALQKRENT